MRATSRTGTATTATTTAVVGLATSVMFHAPCKQSIFLHPHPRPSYTRKPDTQYIAYSRLHCALRQGKVS